MSEEPIKINVSEEDFKDLQTFAKQEQEAEDLEKQAGDLAAQFMARHTVAHKNLTRAFKQFAEEKIREQKNQLMVAVENGICVCSKPDHYSHCWKKNLQATSQTREEELKRQGAEEERKRIAKIAMDMMPKHPVATGGYYDPTKTEAVQAWVKAFGKTLSQLKE